MANRTRSIMLLIATGCFGQERSAFPHDPLNIEQCNAQFTAWKAEDKAAMYQGMKPDANHPGTLIRTEAGPELTNAQLTARHAYVNDCRRLRTKLIVDAQGDCFQQRLPAHEAMECVDSAAATILARYDLANAETLQTGADFQLVERMTTFLKEHKLAEEFFNQRH